MFQVSGRLVFAVFDRVSALVCLCGGRDGVGAGSPAERARRVRFLRAVAVMVAVLLRGGVRARQRRTRSQAQCGGRPFSFVVHGLWPQYEHGFPDYCQRPSPRLDRNIMPSMLDLMPAPGLIFNEWDKHGTCSGLGPRAYFETIRKARSAVKIPPEYLELSEPKTVAPAEIEDAFIKVNPGLRQLAIAVTCNRTRLSEVRICMSKDLQFRACEEIDRRACRRDQVLMPPMRGG